MAPMPTHVISAPTPTITQRYDESPIRKCSCFARPGDRADAGFQQQDEWEPAEDAQSPRIFVGSRHCPVAKNAGSYPESPGLGLENNGQGGAAMADFVKIEKGLGSEG